MNKRIVSVLLLCLGFTTLAHAASVDFSQSRSLAYLANDTLLFENVIIGTDRYAAIMQWNSGSNTLQPVWVGTLNKVEIPFRTMTIDGNDQDWAGIQPAVIDPQGDQDSLYATTPGTDLAKVHIAHDDTYLYFLMTMHNGGPLEGALHAVEFQQFLTQLHTPGDRFTMASYTNGAWHITVNDRSGLPVMSYPADYASGGAGMVEWKVNIADMALPADTPAPYFSPSPVGQQGINNRFIRTYIHPGPHPGPQPLSDDNDSLTRPMIVNYGN